MSEDKKLKNNEKIEAMFNAGVHFGYSKSRRHASVAKYIFGIKNKTEIIDLEKSQPLFDKAIDFISTLAKEGKTILFASSKNEARGIIRDGAMKVAMPFVDGRWIGGTLTNWPEIKKRLAVFEDLSKQKEKGELTKYTKKERILIDKQLSNMEGMFGGIVGMKDLPKALFVVDPGKEAIAVSEANKMKIPVIALASTDCDISKVDFPILGNDSAVSSISYFVNEIVSAYKAGKVSKA